MNNNNNSKNIDREFNNNIIKFLSTNIYNKKIIINKLYNQIKDLENVSSLCNNERNFVIFPELVGFSEAKKTCRIHGGHVAVPKSNAENLLMIDSGPMTLHSKHVEYINFPICFAESFEKDSAFGYCGKIALVTLFTLSSVH